MMGGGIAVLLLIIGVIVTVRSERSLVEERLGRYLEAEAPEVPVEEDARTPLTDWINIRVERSNFGERIARDLARADLQLKPGEYVAVMIIAAFGVAVVGYFFGGRSTVFALIGAVVGLFIPRFFVGRAQTKRLTEFNGQLPDMLNLMVNGLRAGYSTMQAMEAVSKELPAPISSEFRRVVQEMQLGIPMETGLDNLLRRIPSDDLDLAITAINVQREVGGNLAEILDTISYTIRERIKLLGEIRVLTAQVKYSGTFLSLLPIIVSLILWAINRNYMMQFFEEPIACGLGMLGLALVLIGVGYFVMSKVAEIDV
jgi:tight adherence protein B